MSLPACSCGHDSPIEEVPDDDNLVTIECLYCGRQVVGTSREEAARMWRAAAFVSDAARATRRALPDQEITH